MSLSIEHYANSTARIADQANIAAGRVAQDDDTGNRYERTTSGWNQIRAAGAGLSGVAAPTKQTVRDTFTGTGNGASFSLARLPANLGVYSNGSHSGTSTFKLQSSPDNGTTWVDTGTTFTVTGAGDCDFFATQTSPYLLRYVCTAFGAAGSVSSYTEE